jgi:hypothetical protein
MAGQHMEREARYAQTGLTPVQRDQVIWEWHRRGVSYAAIGKRLGMSKSACKYIYDRLDGKPRQQIRYRMCEECLRTFPKDQLTADRLCSECVDAAEAASQL